MKKILLVAFILAFVIMAFCGCSNTLEAVTAEAENPEIFEITLEENPSTGYVWSYEIEDESIVKFVSDEFVGGDDEISEGAPGKHVWVFEGVKDGDTTITFECARSFEDGEPFDIIVYTYSIIDGVAVLVDIEE